MSMHRITPRRGRRNEPHGCRVPRVPAPHPGQLELLNPANPAAAATKSQSGGQRGDPESPSLSSWFYANVIATPGQDAIAVAIGRWRWRTTRALWRPIVRDMSKCDPRLERLGKCGRVRVQPRTEIVQTADGEAYYRGLATCGSVHVCAVCSGKIREERSREFSRVAAAWDAAGNASLLVTFTFPHGVSHQLRDTYDLVTRGWTWVINHRDFKAVRDKLGGLAWARAIETTHGRNGWHPHNHTVMFTTANPALAAAELAGVVRPLWDRFLLRNGQGKSHPLHGVDIRICDSAAVAAEYVTKAQDAFTIGDELLHLDRKRGRGDSKTFFQMLEQYRLEPSVQLRVLCQEYMLVTFGRQAISYSRNFKTMVGQVEQATDDEIAAELPEQSHVLAMLDGPVWDAIADDPMLACRLLEAAEVGGKPAIDAVLAGASMPASLDPSCKAGDRGG